VIASAAWAVTAPVRAQSARDSARTNYSVEIEPHGLVQWDVEPFNHSGFGLGLRVSIPVIRNGPLRTIANSIAIGFGFDWAHSGHCHPYYDPPPRPPYPDGCDVDNFEIPVVAEWNVFLTDRISLMVDLGLDIRYEIWGYDDIAEYDDDDDVDAYPQLLIGPRFIVGNNIAIPIRIGWPYFSVGVSFLL
jgi:hypothetical protein